MHLFQSLLYIHAVSARNTFALTPQPQARRAIGYHLLQADERVTSASNVTGPDFAYCLKSSELPSTGGRGSAIIPIPGPPSFVNLTQQNFKLQEMSSPGLESHRFLLSLSQVQWFFKHKNFSDCCYALISFQSSEMIIFVSSVWLHSCFLEESLPISALGHSQKSCLNTF